jgi:hypothetical protein
MLGTTDILASSRASAILGKPVEPITMPFIEAADLQILQGDHRCGEIDQDVTPLDKFIQIIGYGHAERAATGNQSGIHTDKLVPRPFQSTGQFQFGIFLDRSNNAAAHTPGSSADSNFYHGIPPKAGEGQRAKGKRFFKTLSHCPLPFARYLY